MLGFFIEPPQEVPGDLLEKYTNIFQDATTWKELKYGRRRYPWELYNMQGGDRNGKPAGYKGPISDAQFAQRAVFAKCVDCYNGQPLIGGVTPPTLGPRNRTWWYTAAGGSGLWYYDYFMQQSLDTYLGGNYPDWCYVVVAKDSFVDSYYSNVNYGGNASLGIYYHPTVQRETYITNPNPNLGYLTLDMQSISGCGVLSHQVNAEVWDVPDTWTEFGIKWNNKPAGTNLIKAVSLVPVDGNITINIGAGHPSIMIKATGGNCDGMTFASSEVGFPHRKPFFHL